MCIQMLPKQQRLQAMILKAICPFFYCFICFLCKRKLTCKSCRNWHIFRRIAGWHTSRNKSAKPKDGEHEKFLEMVINLSGATMRHSCHHHKPFNALVNKTKQWQHNKFVWQSSDIMAANWVQNIVDEIWCFKFHAYDGE